MNSHRKIIIFGTLAAMFLCFISGCGEKSGNSQVISAVELKEFMDNGKIAVADGSIQNYKRAPKNQKTALSRTLNWLKQAKPYKGETPIPWSGETSGYSGPAQLDIYTPDKDIYIKISPAVSYEVKGIVFKGHFVKNVIWFNNGGQISYIESRQLYNYLKNNRWKRDFKKEILMN